MAGELNEYDALVRRLTVTCRAIPSRAATVAVNFSKERFRQQNWLPDAPVPWERRRRRNSGRTERRAILVKSGRLLRSIRKISANSDRAIIGTDVEYAQIHNDGGKVQAVASIGAYQKRSYRRKAHTRTRGGRTERINAQTISAHNVKAHRRNINFTMPRRQFLGNSNVLNSRIEELIINDINRALRP